MVNKNFIELNGKRYDAGSGKLLGSAQISHSVTSTPVYPKGHTGRTLDIFTRGSTTTIQKAKVTQKSSAQSITVKKQTTAVQAKKSVPKSINIVQAHKPQTTHTLMRKAVKRPAAGFKSQVNVQSDITRKQPSVIVAKSSVQTISPVRLERAQLIARSQHISKFGKGSNSITARFAPLAVKAAPHKPVAPDVVLRPNHENKPKPTDIFEHALANATNFREIPNHIHFKKKVRRHIVSMAAGTFALIALTGFIAYQQVPGVQLKLAAFNAGVQTGMPNFQAAGFAFDHVIKSQQGQLTIGFAGSSNTRYQLVQQNTNWSGDDMIKNISATDASGKVNYSTINVGNTTVYRLNNDSATWVNNGKWYQVNGTGSLSDGQLQALVTNS